MNILKHGKKLLQESYTYCDSGSYDQFSGSISILNDNITPALPLTYNWYIQSDLWKTRRDVYSQYYGGVCQRCRHTTYSLSLHHVTYQRLGVEALDDLQLLCSRCHFIVEQEKRMEKAYQHCVSGSKI